MTVEPLHLTAKDFASDQTLRWCPGCGDYAIISQVQKTLPKLGIPKEKIVFISGIGCSSRFPYYMNTYGIHSIHGRAPTLATGLKLAKPDPKANIRRPRPRACAPSHRPWAAWNSRSTLFRWL